VRAMGFVRKPSSGPIAAGRRVLGRQWEWSGDANATVLVAGYSHREAYRHAIARGLASTGAGAAVLASKGAGDADLLRPNGSYWRTACAAPGRVLAVTWKGNQANRDFLFSAEEPLRLHDCGDVGTVVPKSMVSAHWRSSFDGIDAVADARAEHVVLLGTPPPKSDEATRAGVPHSPFFVRALAAAGASADTIQITPAAVRVGLWKILQDDLEQQAARIGVGFVPVPPIAQEADGCLKPEYSGGDISHANAAFAALMLGEIEAEAARR
jgi:hypothetical protein